MAELFWKDKRVLVTGGAGFLGSFVVDGLRARGCEQIIAPRSAEVDLRQDAAIAGLLDRETPDDIVGLVLAKDYWLHEDQPNFVLRDHLREPLFVPATRAAERVLEDLRRTRAHLAVVLDEYGGTAGIVTMEDLVEEVVGDIADEYDPYSRDALLFDGVLELAG